MRTIEDFELVEDLPIILPRVYQPTPPNECFSARYYYNEEDELKIEFG